MKIYVIYCYFCYRGDSERYVSEVVNRFEGIRFLPDAWLIKSDIPSQLILDEINEHLDTHDYVLINELTADYACKQPKTIERWINKNILNE